MKHLKKRINKEVDELLDDVAYNIMEESVQRDIWEEKGVAYFG